MIKELKDLVEISRFYGSDPDFVIAGGGNTSFKDDRHIWVKASGFSMNNIDIQGFVQLYRDKVKDTGKKKYSADPHQREVQVKEDLLTARVHPESGLRPSVETSLHEVIGYPFVIHTHPTLVNALMCSVSAEEKTKEFFGDEVLFVPYAPGYRLFKSVSALLGRYRKTHERDPQLIFLQNHGIFIGAGSVSEIKDLYDFVIGKIRKTVDEEPLLPVPKHPDTDLLTKGLLSMVPDKNNTIVIRHNSLHRYFYERTGRFNLISRPFTPDIIVYCGPAYLYSDKDDLSSVLSDLKNQWDAYLQKFKKQPKIILVKEYGLIAVEESKKPAETALGVFEDFMKISKYSEAFGGPHPMPEEEIDFIDRWEVENYRRNILRSANRISRKAR
ncbi:MAG: class II aldolase [Chlorobi bacterium]|nr:class II aldolase [Chlorobiota bacterium]